MICQATDDVFDEIKSMLKGLDIIPVNPLDKTTCSFIYYIVDINKKFGNVLILLKEILKIEDPILYQYFSNLHKESIESISTLGSVYNLDWSKLSKWEEINKSNWNSCYWYKKNNYNIIFVMDMQTKNIEKSIKLIEYWYSLYFYFKNNYETLKSKNTNIVLKLWYSCQQIFTILHYQLFIYTGTDVFNHMFQQSSNMPDIPLQNLDNINLGYKMDECQQSKYPVHFSKVKQIDFNVIHKLNIYLKHIIDADISIISICKINDGTPSIINYSETNTYNTNYIDYGIIKSGYRK